LLLQCNNYNFTHTHRGLSFENTLMDATLFLNDSPGAQVLAGASDEVTETSFKILQRLGAVKKEFSGSDGIKSASSTGIIAGEGSAFFLLNNSEENALAKISALKIFSNPDANEISSQLNKFVNDHKLSPNDLVLYGFNGDANGDVIYNDAKKKFFNGCQEGFFKHLCGEYHTATAFATWIAALILKNQSVPGYLLLNDQGSDHEVNKVLIFNHYKGREFALILLEKC